MGQLLPILARDEDSGTGRIIFFALVAVFWIISAIASSIKNARKKAEVEAARRAKAQQPGWVAAPPPVPQQIPSFPAHVRARVQGAPALQQPPVIHAPTLPQYFAVPEAPSPRMAPLTAAPPPQPVAPRPPAVDARAIRRWLTPEVMQRQYIVTEIFDPPPASRG